MGTDSNIDPETVRAYLETEYRVGGEYPMTLVVGSVSKQLLAVYNQAGISSCAFLTACNPYSIALGAEENAMRQKKLALLLAVHGYRYAEGVGQHPTNGWPGEPSYLIWGIPRWHACAIAEEFQQNALIWAGAEGRPELILLR